MMRDMVKSQPKPKVPEVAVRSFTLEQLWDDAARAGSSRRI
jgi:hypothetical protein